MGERESKGATDRAGAAPEVACEAQEVLKQFFVTTKRKAGDATIADLYREGSDCCRSFPEAYLALTGRLRPLSSVIFAKRARAGATAADPAGTDAAVRQRTSTGPTRRRRGRLTQRRHQETSRVRLRRINPVDPRLHPAIATGAMRFP